MKRLITLGLMLLSLSGLAASATVSPHQLTSTEIKLTQQTTVPQPDQDIDRMLEERTRRRQEQQENRANQLFTGFSQKFGYNPKDYELSFLLSGNTISVYDAGYWVRFNVKPEEGIIKVAHTTSVMDWFWGTTNWYDHETVSIRFILDSDACQAVSQGENCQFTGKNEVKLPNFLSNHQIIKHGIWEIKYIESNEQREVAFRVPKDGLPKGSDRGASMKAINNSFCEVFPDGLDCKK